MMRRRTVLAGGLTVLFGLPGCSIPVIPKRPHPGLRDAQAWVRFAGGRYTLFVPRAEMGQNIATALRQVACDALQVGPEHVDVRLPSTADIGRVRATVGSESIKDFAAPLAQACQALRQALSSGRASEVIDLRDRAAQPLKDLVEEGRWTRRRAALEQGSAIVRGEPLYAADVRRPGQLHGRVLRGGTSPEIRSRLQSVDEAAARQVPGFVMLVRDGALTLGDAEGLGIVASTPGALDRIEAALAPRWRVSGRAEQADVDSAIDVNRRLATGSLAHTLHEDRIDVDAGWDVDLQLSIPAAAHGAIEPRAAVADCRDSRLEVWAGTQDAFYVRDVLVKRLGLEEAGIVVHSCRVGGAFGGKTLCTVELEAAVLSRDAKAPVKVQWTRAQELQYGFHRAPSSHRIRATLRAGKLDQWWHAFASSNILFTNAALPPWLQVVTSVVADGGVARGAALAYRARARRTEFDVVRLPVLTGPWRGLGAGPNVTAIECAIDECARVAGIDPVEFRLRHIEDPRLARVLQRVAQASRWRSPAASTAVRTGRGVACGIYKGASYAAVVADVAVAQDGTPRVTQLWCAHDCGFVVNPDQVRAQCEGNLVWGVGMVLTDGLTLAHGEVAARSFADAPIPSLALVPRMEVELVDEGDEPAGAGETAIVAAAGAILNAIRSATGIRVNRLPVTRLAVPT